jgi:hypothetical protein
MTDKTISNDRPVGGDYFYLKYLRSSEYKLDHHLNLFDPEDYWIYKLTSKQRLVTIEQLYEFNYSGYIFFRKTTYDNEYIMEWLRLITPINGMNYLTKPFPPREIMNKINVIK